MGTASRAGYDVVRELPIDRVSGRYVELEHRRSGLRHVHLGYAESNAACFIAVRTRAEDDTGVAHVLEHMCFQGSRRFGVSALKDSNGRLLATGGAHTRADHTLYNFHSRHPQGFLGMLDLFLDAVFQPRLDDEAFWQEAWRYELREEPGAADLSLTGRVYNEMKGITVNDFYNLWEGVGRSLYPGTPFAHNAGGDPATLLTLTPQATREFHQRYYYPANAVIVTAGAIDLDAVLTCIEASGVNDIERREPAADIPADGQGFRPRRATVRKSPDGSAVAQSVVAWAAPFPSTDPLGFRGLAVLGEALLGSADAPLRAALSEAGFGAAAADAPRLLDDYPNPGLVAGSKGDGAADGERLQTVLLESLDKLARGIPQEHLDRALDTLEVDLFDRGPASYLGLVTWDFWLRLAMPAYKAAIGGADPHRFIDWEPDLAELRRWAQRGGYFEELVRTSLVDNVHRVQLTLLPDPAFEDYGSGDELRHLQETSRTLSDVDRDRVRERSSLVAARQHVAADKPVQRAVDPRDLPKPALPAPLAARAAGRSSVSVYDSHSEGLTDLALRFDATGLDQAQLALLPLLGRVLANAIGGGFEAETAVVHDTAGTPACWLTVSGKTLLRRAQSTLARGAAVLTEPRYGGGAVGDARAALVGEKDKELVYTWSAPRLALRLAGAQLGPAGAVAEQLSGVSQLSLLRGLDAEQAAEQLSALAKALIGRGRLHCFASAPARVADELGQSLDDLLSALPQVSEPTALVAALSTAPADGAEGWATTADQAFNACAYPAVPFGHPAAAALSVAASTLSLGSTVQSVSRERGAYGATADFDPLSARFGFTSWFDPHVLATYDAFDAAVAEAVEGRLDPEQVREAAGLLVATGGGAQLSSDELARRDWTDRLLGVTHETRLAFDRAISEVTPADIQEACRRHLGSPRRATLGSATLMAAARAERPGWFDRIGG